MSNKLKIESVSISDIMPYYNNPRENTKAVKPVVESIKRYGFIKPIICDSGGVIIAGHTRYIAAYQMGLKYVPVIYSDMDVEQAKMYRIADNKLAEKSIFDEDALLAELKSFDIPQDMQSFFFEDINDILGLGYNEITSQSPVSSYYDDDDFIQRNELDDDNLEEIPSQTYNRPEPYCNSDDFEVDNDDEEFEEEDKEIEVIKVVSNELYKVREIDGKKTMLVVCPYCGNVEQIEIN